MTELSREGGRAMAERPVRLERQRGSGEDERPLRAIIEQLADGIIIVGTDGVIRFANPAAEQLFARSARHLVGTDFGFAIATGGPAEIELVRPDGKPVTAELRVADVAWHGEAARLVSIRDITDRRRAEERARQVEQERAARAQAEAANRAKSEFLATMSHELRTPLNAVIGYAQLLDLGIGGPLSPEQQHQVGRIYASSRHLLGLVNEVLDLAKADVGQLRVQLAAAPADSTADAAAALVQPAAEARGITFAVRAVGEGARGAEAAGGAGGAQYDGDEDRVRQILVNLLTNAVKFTDAGGSVVLEYGQTTRPDPNARLAAGRAWVHFTVRDTGVGIPADQLARIFEPFVQVTTGHTRPNDGSGLGLAISRRLARLMHGDITVRSRPGEGSTFTLWLPSAAPAARVPAAEDVLPVAPSGPPHGLAEVGEILMRHLQPLLEVFVARLRAECPAPSAAGLKFSQLVDHLASYLADLAGALIALEEAGGQPSSVVVDATEIHRVVAARHGAQRARLGWTEEAIRCEYRILREEVERAVRQHEHALGAAAIGEALAVAARFLDQARELSLRAYARATGGRRA
ncbi:MAG TPA: PAS domain-containing sensor histidine kinase [Gemmatimonadaceae bacterium]|nr:PAS domain-containing sensor histidine kinase [Gemmatimonadaceae bacterium]